jgi:sRNA-binding regulator protein Hfq
MSIEPTPPGTGKRAAKPLAQAHAHKRTAGVAPFRLSAFCQEQESPQRNAELFYLQKQIQMQTPMVLVLQDGERIEGCIEWYDRNALKIRGNSKILVYKSAIKYMYKVGDQGQ